jgi:hypothetical protein
MGYDLHITRAELWADNEGREISADEWHALVDADPELELAGYNGPHFAFWTAHPTDPEAWLNWSSGNIETKNPDRPLVGKMIEIAGRLEGRVQGDDGELYPTIDAFGDHGVSPDAASASGSAAASSALRGASIRDYWPLVSLVLAIIALAALGLLLPLDAWIRTKFPVGQPVPMNYALLLALVGMVAVMGWFLGSVLGVASLAFRLRRASLAWLALAVNGITAAVVWLAG